jgi:hypothetical protein
MPFDPIPEWLINYRSLVLYLNFLKQAMSIEPVPVLSSENAQYEHDHQHKSLEHFLECIQMSSENGVDLICLGPLSNLTHWMDHLENEDKLLLASKINHMFILVLGVEPIFIQMLLQRQGNPEFDFSLDPQAVY